MTVLHVASVHSFNQYFLWSSDMPGRKTERQKDPCWRASHANTMKMHRKFFDRAAQVEGAVLRGLMSAGEASRTGSLRRGPKE